MLVACSLVNRTTWGQAKSALAQLRGRYASPRALSLAREADLHDALRPLGLWRRRARSLVLLSRSWETEGPPTTADDVLRRPSCGPYASQSWAIFVEGREVDRSAVTDHKLGWYLDSMEREG